MTTKDHCGRANRRGAGIVEFAVIAPLLFLLALGLVEYARIEMVIQGMTAAAQEGCRAGIVPGSTSADVRSRTNDVLRDGLVTGSTVSISPPEVATLKQGQTFTVTVQVPMDGNSWVPRPLLPAGKVLKTRCTMTRESK
jgi:Flp pilus assembly protein TadG